ncbi:unnamed protein product [Anisakis simplex]|uniref:CCHC NOA-type domain-containing protein n=1 Tax=Anisakis simplex TaxID=6269 RepID=A0A0M3K7V6_ANISI|nr:unnamed protein product [Anisakis simplex]
MLYGFRWNVVELSKVRGLGAAPQSVPLSNGVIPLDQSKLGELEQELAEQQKRNNELREANYKVVEMSQKQDQMYGKRIAEMEKKFEKSLKEERSAIVDQLQKILPADMKLKSPPQQCTQEQYKQWICDATEALKKRSSAAAKVSAPQTPKIESIPNSDSTHDEDHENQFTGRCDGILGKFHRVLDISFVFLQPSANERPLSMSKVASTQKSDVQIEELESKVERYRVALATVSSTIDAIEHEAAQKEKHYEREIALLKKELNRQVAQVSNLLKYERSYGTRLNAQASVLRGILRGNHDANGNEFERSVDDGTVHSQLQHPVGGGSLGTVQTADGGKYQHHRRRTRSGRRYWTNNPGGQENDPTNFLNGSKRSTAEQNRRRRKKCLSESAATHVTFGMTTTAASGNDNERESSSGRRSLEDEWEVVD